MKLAFYIVMLISGLILSRTVAISQNLDWQKAAQSALKEADDFLSEDAFSDAEQVLRLSLQLARKSDAKSDSLAAKIYHKIGVVYYFVHFLWIH